MTDKNQNLSEKHPFSTLQDWRFFCSYRKLNPAAKQRINQLMEHVVDDRPIDDQDLRQN